MKQKKFLLIHFLALFLSVGFTSCEKDEEGTKNVSVTVNEDGSVLGNHTFSVQDDKTFYIDCVKYEVKDGHL